MWRVSVYPTVLLLLATAIASVSGWEHSPRYSSAESEAAAHCRLCKAIIHPAVARALRDTKAEFLDDARASERHFLNEVHELFDAEISRLESEWEEVGEAGETKSTNDAVLKASDAIDSGSQDPQLSPTEQVGEEKSGAGMPLTSVCADHASCSEAVEYIHHAAWDVEHTHRIAAIFHVYHSDDPRGSAVAGALIDAVLCPCTSGTLPDTFDMRWAMSQHALAIRRQYELAGGWEHILREQRPAWSVTQHDEL